MIDLRQILTSVENIDEALLPALVSYSESKIIQVSLPEHKEQALVTSFNSLGKGRYFDYEKKVEYRFDYFEQKVSDLKLYTPESRLNELRNEIHSAMKNHTADHYPSCVMSVNPIENDSQLAIVVVVSENSFRNFWTGQWRLTYVIDPDQAKLTGLIGVDVHYYEDGNVRLMYEKPVSEKIGAPSDDTTAFADKTVELISSLENKFQLDISVAFEELEKTFKRLRRPLPLVGHKIDWNRIATYRIGQEIGGKPSNE